MNSKDGAAMFQAALWKIDISGDNFTPFASVLSENVPQVWDTYRIE